MAEAGTPASPRPAGRPRKLPENTGESVFQSFDCETEEVPPGTMAPPRPLGKERRVSAVPPAISGADVLVQCLVNNGVDNVFAYPGGATMPIYQALMRYEDR